MKDDARPGIRDLGKKLRNRRLSCADLARDCLDRIHALDPDLNAFVSVHEETAMALARRCDRELGEGRDRGPLHGIPVALKNNIDCAGEYTTSCSRAFRDNLAEQDADCVTRLRDAGAVIIGRTNMHELAYGGTGQASADGPARNPWDRERLAGGSSSGSAAAVAAGMVPAALGSDTGGSVRIPASACGVVGFKPSLDSISTRGVVPLSWTLDTVGPLTRSVADAAIVAEALGTPGSPLEGVSEGMCIPGEHSLTLGVARFPDLALDPAVEGRLERTLALLGDAGHRIERFDLHRTREAHASWLAIMYPEATSRFESALAERYGDFDVSVRTQLEAGRHVRARTYLRAQRFRAFYARAVAAATRGYDLVCMPTLPTVAPKVGQETVTLPSGTVSTQDAMTFSNLTANLLGWPAISLPLPSAAGELPVGITLMRTFGADAALLGDAARIERTLRDG